MTSEIRFRALAELDEQLAHIAAAPRDEGSVDLIVCRPAVGERRELDAGELSLELGLVGDNWKARGKRNKAAHPDMQLNLMNMRALAAIEPDPARWPLAGDQFYVDFNLSDENLPSGTQLTLGEAVIEVTAEPHLGCAKFQQRFGRDAVAFVNSEAGKALNLRGINAKVVQPGWVHIGDRIGKR